MEDTPDDAANKRREYYEKHFEFRARDITAQIVTERIARREKGKIRYFLSFLNPISNDLLELNLRSRFFENLPCMNDEEKEIYERVKKEIGECPSRGESVYSYSLADRVEKSHKKIRIARDASILLWGMAILISIGLGASYVYKNLSSEERKTENGTRAERYNAYVRNDSYLPTLTLDELMNNEGMYVNKGINVIGRPLSTDAGGKPNSIMGVFYVVLGDDNSRLLGESYEGLLYGGSVRTPYNESLKAKTLIDAAIRDTTKPTVRLRGVYLGNNRFAVGEVEAEGQKVDIVDRY